MLFVEQKEFVWGLIASMYLGNIVGLLVVLTCVPVFASARERVMRCGALAEKTKPSGASSRHFA